MTGIYDIGDVPLFRNLPPAQIGLLGNAAVRDRLKAGEIVFHQGDAPEFLYIVESGAVDILLPVKGDEVVLASFETGSFFGELAIFDSQPRTATARAAL